MTFGDVGLNYVPVDRYVSGSPWNKKWAKRAIGDIYHFARRSSQYHNKNYARSHELYGSGFYGMFQSHPQFVPLTWTELQMCYYGKGSPLQFGYALRIIDYYLQVADMNLGYLGWNGRMSLVDYAHWYLGLDCNGFAGAYYEAAFPATGIDGNDHINFLHTKSTLSERKTLEEIRPGDLLVRCGSDGASGRHVAVIDSILVTSATRALTIVTQSSSSFGGLTTQPFTLADITSEHRSDVYGTRKWSLVDYHQFHRVLGPKA
jgi:hypothetical protein